MTTDEVWVERPEDDHASTTRVTQHPLAPMAVPFRPTRRGPALARRRQTPLARLRP